MIKAVLTNGGRRILLIGLSGENMTRLMADEPIPLDAAELGLPRLPIVIVGGRTEADIQTHVLKVGGRLGATMLTAAGTDHSQMPPGPDDYAAAAAALGNLPYESGYQADQLAVVALNAAYAARANLAAAGRAYTCPRCLTMSHNPSDAEHGYCGACHDYTGAQVQVP